MAKFIFNLPDIGEGIAEAEIVAWHVKIGDVIAEDQPIADMMTDKATVEMESPVAGVVTALAGEAGDVIAIGSMLVEVEVEGGDASASAQAGVHHEGEQSQTEEILSESLAATAERSGDRLPPVREHISEQDTASAVEHAQRKITASPAVRKRAADLGVDLSGVKAPGGHVRHADLDAYLTYGSAQGYRPTGAAKREDQAIKVIGLRRRIAENMAASKRHIPHFAYVEEIDVTAIEEMRADLNAHRGSRPKLTLLPLLIAAICKAVPDFPMINATYDDEAGVVTRHGAVHLGMATQTAGGLMVPVIRDAQDRNIWQLAAEIVRLAEAARGGTATIGELSGSTLTITSLGPLGGIATTPVINRPEVAIIGPNRIVERPVFAKNAAGGDEIRRAKLMNLSISCDHRVVDGHDAASFVHLLKRYLETPVLLFAD